MTRSLKIAVACWMLLAGLGLAVPALGGATDPSASFVVYDNLFYRGKPSTARAGLIASNILYENRIWPDKQDVGKLPDREAFQALVHAVSVNPGPLVIDIESLPLRASLAEARRNEEILAQLADWAKQAAPGRPVGFYGTNTLSNVPAASLGLAKELATHVDAFFPPMYTFDDDRSAWETRAKATAMEARTLDPHKPIYFYLWPQYHDGTPKAFQFIDAEYWQTQLIASHREANGVVLWSPSRYEWNDQTGWWRSTVEFIRNIRPVIDPIPR
jgi:hypothetical protein